MNATNASTEPASSERDPRVYFAAERTFLAWIRTGLALMGFGFVVARFGLFLRELGMSQSRPSHSTGTSLWFGTALVLVGVLVNLGATLNHLQQVKALHSGTWQAGRPSKIGIAVALLLTVAGIGLAAYLVLVRR